MLMPGENSAAPGNLLSVIVFGLAPVRLDMAVGALKAGMRLTAGTNGQARSLQTVEVDGVTLSETGPSLVADRHSHAFYPLSCLSRYRTPTN